MLVLTRCPDESFNIGEDIVIKLMHCNNYRAKIGIEAPKHIEIWRDDCKKRLSRAEYNENIQQDIIDLMRAERDIL